MKELKLRRVKHDDIDAVDQAIADGYQFISTLHYYELNLPTLEDKIHILHTKLDCRKRCVDIVLAEFRHSRLYQDPKIPFEEAQKNYKGRVNKAWDDDMVFIAFHEQKGVIGFCVLEHHAWTRAECEISLIAVSKEFQRKGIGSRLVERCIIECKLRHVKILKINTQGHNEATRAFCDKLGFKRTLISKDFHKHEDMA